MLSSLDKNPLLDAESGSSYEAIIDPGPSVKIAPRKLNCMLFVLLVSIMGCITYLVVRTIEPLSQQTGGR